MVAVVIAALSMMMGVALPLMCTLYCSRDRRASEAGGTARYPPSSFFLLSTERAAVERCRLTVEGLRSWPRSWSSSSSLVSEPRRLGWWWIVVVVVADIDLLEVGRRRRQQKK